MNCPSCGRALTHPVRQCSYCEFAFDEETFQKLFFYFDLKNEAKNLAASESALLARIQKLTQKIDRYETILNSDLESAMRSAASGGLRAPVPGHPAGATAPAGSPGANAGAGASERASMAAMQAADSADAKAAKQAPPETGEKAPSARAEDEAREKVASKMQDIQQKRADIQQQADASKKSAFAAKPAYAPKQSKLEERQGPAPSYTDRGASARSATDTMASNDQGQSFEMLIGQKWMLIMGIITMVFGVGYFLKYSFDQNWIGPAGRVAMSYALGILFLAGGNQFVTKGLSMFGLYLIGGGVAVLYFSAFAAFSIYNLFDQIPSFAIMTMITVFAGFLAIYYNAMWLAALGLIGGFLTPALLSTGKDNIIGLMTYMTILNLGMLGVSFKKNWPALNIFGFIGTYILFAGWYERHFMPEKFWPAILFLNVFFLIYSVAPFAYQFMRKDPGESKGFTIITLNAFVAFGFSYNMIKAYFGATHYVSVITVLYALVFLAMGSHLFKMGKQVADSFVIVLAEASFFLILTVPMIFSGHWITFFWMAQALVLMWMATRLSRGMLYGGAYALAAIALLKLFFYDYHEIFRFDVDRFAFIQGFGYILTERYIAVGGTLAILWFMAQLAKTTGVSHIVRDAGDGSAINGIFGILLFISLNFEVGGFFYEHLLSGRLAAISVLWALFSIALTIRGFVRDNGTLRKIAIGLFLVTLLKVFLFDMAELETPYRIASFMGLGGIMTLASWFYHNHMKNALNKDRGNQ